MAFLCAIQFTFLTMSANAAFFGCLPVNPGGADYQAYYDDQLDITWLANADAAKGTIYDDGESATDGAMTLASAMAWLDNLNINGVSGWRLPDMDVNRDGDVVNCRLDPSACKDNEMGYLYWVEGVTYSTPLPFSNIHMGLYWSGTEYNIERMWTFDMYVGDRDTDGKNFELHTWTVHDGDVGVNVKLLPTGTLMIQSSSADDFILIKADTDE